MNEALNIETLSSEIAKRLSKAPPPDKVIWDSDDCAAYFSCSRRHFIDRISKQPSFPQPVINLSCRWLMISVVEWASKT